MLLVFGVHVRRYGRRGSFLIAYASAVLMASAKSLGALVEVVEHPLDALEAARRPTPAIARGVPSRSAMTASRLDGCMARGMVNVDERSVAKCRDCGDDVLHDRGRSGGRENPAPVAFKEENLGGAAMGTGFFVQWCLNRDLPTASGLRGLAGSALSAPPCRQFGG